MIKKVFLKSWGCQMNNLDSAIVENALRDADPAHKSRLTYLISLHCILVGFIYGVPAYRESVDDGTALPQKPVLRIVSAKSTKADQILSACPASCPA
jgi:hypothetical protein